MIKVGSRVTFKSIEKAAKELGDGSPNNIITRCGYSTDGMGHVWGNTYIVTDRVIPEKNRFTIRDVNNYVFSMDMVESYTNFITIGCRYGISSVDVTDTITTDYPFKVHVSVGNDITVGDIVVAQDKNGIRLLTVTNLEVVEEADANSMIICKVDLEEHRRMISEEQE